MRSAAPDHLAPFTARIEFRTSPAGIAAPAPVVAGLLNEIAKCCEQAGSSLIGHIKAHAKVESDGLIIAFHCNLTDTRHGARCAGNTLMTLEPGQRLRVDLAVLVYGLAKENVEQIVRDSCRSIGGERSLDIEIQ